MYQIKRSCEIFGLKLEQTEKFDIHQAFRVKKTSFCKALELVAASDSINSMSRFSPETV